MKNWYNKKTLKDFKWLVDNGHRTQNEYDELERLMKTFDLDNKDIVNKTIDHFMTFKEEVEVCYSQLLSECLSLNALEFFDTNDLFNLYDLFFKECKKRKIKFGFHEYEGPVGLPFNLGFWRIDRPLTNKITYNLFYGCWGRRGELSRTYVIFEKHKITYCNEPLDNYSNKNNCLIKVSYDPTREFDYELINNVGLSPIRPDDGDSLFSHSSYDFCEICECAENIAINHKNDAHVCDAIPASLVISNDEKGKKIINGLCFEETEGLDSFVKKYMPESFKKAIEFDKN